MIRQWNRAFKNWLRPKRIALGRMKWDKKISKDNLFQDDILKKNHIESILFMRYDGKIGDMVVNTPMFREIKKAYPHMKIGVVTRGGARDIIGNNPYVDKIYTFDKNSDAIKVLAGKLAEEKYDLLIDFSETLRVNEMMFINLCRARINMGLDKKGWKLFDISIDPDQDFSWNEHITKRYRAYLRRLGIEDPNLRYEIFIEMEREKKVKIFLEGIREKKKMVLNPYGASSHRTLRDENLEFIGRYANQKDIGVVLIASPDKREHMEKFIGGSSLDNLYFYPEGTSILDSAALIKGADLVITPDTSIIHIACALNKGLIGIYRKDRGNIERINEKVWAPLGAMWQMLLCDGDINDFDREEMERAIDEKTADI